MVKNKRGDKTAETPAFWCGLIEAARTDYEGKHSAVHRAIHDAYTGRAGFANKEYGGVKLGPSGRPYQTNVRPPRMYSLTHGMEAMLFHRRPKFFVKPYAGRLEKMASDFERLTNAMWPRFVSDKEMRWIIRDAIKYGRGWGLVGFDFDEAEERSRLNERKRVARMLKESVMAQAAPTETLAQTVEPVVPPADNEVEEENLFGDSRSRLRRPSFRRVPPGDVTYDPGACTEFDAKWIDVRSYVDMESLKADPFFKGAKDVKPVGKMQDGKWRSITGGPNVNTGARVIDTPAEYPKGSGGVSGECYEYAEVHYTAVKRPGGRWDILIYAKGQETFGRRLTAPYWFGCPLVSLAWNDDGDSLDTISDGERLLSGIVEEASLRTRLKDHWNRKPNDVIAVDEAVINNTSNKSAIEVQKTATFLPMRRPTETATGIPFSNYFFPIPRNANIAEVYQQIQLIAKDFEAVTGLGPNQQLQALKSETSSFEAQEIARNARSRGVEKQEAVEAFAARIAHMMLMLAAQFFDAERAAEFISGEAVNRWKGYDFSPGDVQDNLGVEVERGSMKPQSSDAREQLYTLLLQLGLQNPAFAAKIQLDKVFLRLMEEKGVLDGTELLNAGVDVGQMVVALMQMQLSGAGGGGSPPKQPQPGGSTQV